MCLRCTPENHVWRVLEVVLNRGNVRVAVVSENDDLLAEVRREAEGLGIRCFELIRVENLDMWKTQEGDALAASLVLSRLEAVKGFEFDTVIACDLSEGVIPGPGTPPDEYWREAAVVYSALTRARDELIMTYVGEPSLFLKAMSGYVAMHEIFDEVDFARVLESV